MILRSGPMILVKSIELNAVTDQRILRHAAAFRLEAFCQRFPCLFSEPHQARLAGLKSRLHLSDPYVSSKADVS
jgi:hypothetical protein